jgi:hypothetical protein
MAETTYRIRESFMVPDGDTGMPRVLQAGDFLPASDPLAKTHRHLLEPLSEVVEQATAAPGEKRDVDYPSGVTNARANKPRDTRVGTRNQKQGT